MGFKPFKTIKKAAKKAGSTIKKTAQAIKHKPVEGLKDLATKEIAGRAVGLGPGGALAAELGAEAGGAALGDIQSQLGSPEEAAALDLSPIVDEDEEAAKQAKLIAESKRRNAPGVRQQSVFTSLRR